MIHVHHRQGSAEWLQARVGIATASQFDRIITPKTMKLSDQAAKYAHQLIAEQVLGYPMNNASSSFMERGNDLEARAVSFYQLQKDMDTEPGGFFMRDDKRVGASPDRVVGTDGLLEIKCPSAAVHVGYLLDDQGIGYRAQVQGQLWVAEREWIDTLSYHPELPSAIVRVERDEEFITKLAQAVNTFLGMMDDMRDKLQKFGLFEGQEFPALTLVKDAANV
jgi:hypothetical protein